MTFDESLSKAAEHSNLNDVFCFSLFQCNDNGGLPDFTENNYESSEQTGHDEKEDQGDMSFCMSSYARETMKMMSMMRSHQMLTDVVLEVQQELFPAHKAVLSATSPYFKAMFTGGLKESEMSRIKLEGVSNQSLSITCI